jgi:hypothetical protein
MTMTIPISVMTMEVVVDPEQVAATGAPAAGFGC